MTTGQQVVVFPPHLEDRYDIFKNNLARLLTTQANTPDTDSAAQALQNRIKSTQDDIKAMEASSGLICLRAIWPIAQKFAVTKLANNALITISLRQYFSRLFADQSDYTLFVSPGNVVAFFDGNFNSFPSPVFMQRIRAKDYPEAASIIINWAVSYYSGWTTREVESELLKLLKGKLSNIPVSALSDKACREFGIRSK